VADRGRPRSATLAWRGKTSLPDRKELSDPEGRVVVPVAAFPHPTLGWGRVAGTKVFCFFFFLCARETRINRRILRVGGP